MPPAVHGSGMSDRWRAFYRDLDYDHCIYREGEAMIDYLERFFERRGVPGTMLSVGCGPAVLEFEVAERYPEMAVTGVDVAEQVVEDARKRAADRGLPNLSFRVGELPDIDLGERFDLVYCMATLYFVEDVAVGLRSLYDHVAPGGHLIADYPTERLREWAASQDEQTRAFFERVIDGENLTTAAEVASLFEQPVEEYGAVVDAGESLPDTVVVGKS